MDTLDSARERALLDAVLAAPEADEPRRVLADALAEQGDPYGEFINIQLDLAAGRGQSEALQAREAELCAAHEGSWRERLPRVRGLVWGPFRRGFVDSVVVSSAPNFVTKLELIRRASPLVELRLRSLREGEHARLAACEGLASFDRLRLHNVWVTPELLASDVFAGLVELELVNARSRDVAEVVFAREFNRLRALGLDSQYIRAAGAAALASATKRWPEALRALDLRRNALDDVGLDAFASSARLDGLERLGLAENNIHVEALARLAERLEPGRLRALDLRCNPIGDEGAKLLASHPAFAGLVELDLRACSIHDAGAEALAASPPLTKLERLDLACNYIAESGMIALMEAGHLPELDFNRIEGWDNQLLAPMGEEPYAERSFRFDGEQHYCWSGRRHDGRQTLVFVDDDIELYDYARDGRLLGRETLPRPTFERPPEHSYEPFNALELLEHLFAVADFNPCEIELTVLPGERDMSFDIYTSTMVE